MRAAVVVAPGRVEVKHVARPIPAEGQVRVRLEGCGVCSSNLVPWAGPDWMKFPTTPGELGHEGWGVIDAVGEGVSTSTIGQRVATLSHRSYADYDIADAGAVIPLPPTLDDQPFPGEPLGCAMNIMRRSGIEQGQTVAVVGAGFLGCLLIQLAAARGCRVIAISRRPSSLALARVMGARETIALESRRSVIDQVQQLTDCALCDVAIEVAGKQEALDLSAELTRERGRLLIAGYHQDGPRSVNMQLWNWRGLDVVNAHERDPAVYRRGVQEAIDAVVAGTLNLSGFYTHTFPLDRLADALNATRDRPEGFVKALVLMQ